MFEALDGLDADLRVLRVGGVDGDDLCETYGGFAFDGVVDDELFAFLHGAEVEQGLVVG